MNFELLNAAKLNEMPDMTGRIWHGDPPQMDTDICPYCGQELNEDLEESIVESPRGLAHEECYQGWLDDAPGRAADFYFDTAGDR